MENITATFTIDSYSNYQDLLVDLDTRENYEKSIREGAEGRDIEINEFIYDEDQDLVMVNITAPSRINIEEWMWETSPELSDEDVHNLIEEALAS